MSWFDLEMHEWRKIKGVAVKGKEKQTGTTKVSLTQVNKYLYFWQNVRR